MPGAQEGISYQIPSYKKDGGYLVYFAGRFPLAEPVPVKLIERIAKFLAREAAEHARAEVAGSKNRR